MHGNDVCDVIIVSVRSADTQGHKQMWKT